MAPKDKVYTEGKPVVFSPNGTTKKSKPQKDASYRSEGVSDNDIFELPGSDYQLLSVLTIIAACFRLFRIYQPSSVVFDEVQYVESRLG
jgi:dolichyl-phosphate-mannose-protein mannosyltransferase